jgi:hypothetical protein
VKEGKEAVLFWKKEPKNLCPLEPGRSPVAHAKWTKVFCFFFSKKKRFLSRFRP